jgi:hypothetical protein
MPVDTKLLNRILIADGMMSPDKLEEFLPLRGTTAVSGGNRGGSTAQPEMIGRQGGEGFFTQIGKAFGQLGKALETPGFRETLARIGGSIAAPGSWQQRLGGETATVNREQAQMGASQNVLAKVLSGQQLTAADFQGLTPEQSAQVTQLSMEKARNEAVAQYYQGSLAAQGTPESRAEEERRNMLLQQALEEGAPQKVGAVVGPSGVDRETLYKIDESGNFIPISSGTTTRSTGGEGGMTVGQQENLFFRMDRSIINEVSRNMPEPDRFFETVDENGIKHMAPVWNSPELQAEFQKKYEEKVAREQKAGRLPVPWMGVDFRVLEKQAAENFIGPPAPKNLNTGKVKIGAY